MEKKYREADLDEQIREEDRRKKRNKVAAATNEGRFKSPESNQQQTRVSGSTQSSAVRNLNDDLTMASHVSPGTINRLSNLNVSASPSQPQAIQSLIANNSSGGKNGGKGNN